jgi:hypothetical protein
MEGEVIRELSNDIDRRLSPRSAGKLKSTWCTAATAAQYSMAPGMSFAWSANAGPGAIA